MRLDLQISHLEMELHIRPSSICGHEEGYIRLYTFL